MTKPFPASDFASEDFDNLVAEMRACAVCAAHLPQPPNPVFSVSPRARLALISQAPGVRADRAGRPFADPSGVRLRDWMGVSEEEFYDPDRLAITPMGLCFPGWDAKGGDLPPRRECAPRWQKRIEAALPEIELSLLVGGYAQTFHLGARARPSLTETVAAWRDYLPRYLPMPHPSWRNNGWLRKNPWFEAELLPELRRRVRTLMERAG